jgi:hypothetical protein
VAGKGDTPRPLSVTPEQFAANFDAIDWNAREREQDFRDAAIRQAQQVGLAAIARLRGRKEQP